MKYGTLRTYTPQDDVWVMLIIVACFLALVLLIGHQRKYIGSLSRKFFMPTNRQEKPAQKTTGEKFLPALTAITLVCSSGLILFAYANINYNLEQSPFYIWSVLLLALGAFGGYYLLRWLLYSFVNWVFFDRHQRQQWKEGFGLLMIYESVVIFVMMCTSMFFHLDLQEMLLLVAICYGLLRLAVIPYTKRIFFPDFYGLLHIITYLCTLEILPMLALYKFCMYWGSLLVAG